MDEQGKIGIVKGQKLQAKQDVMQNCGGPCSGVIWHIGFDFQMEPIKNMCWFKIKIYGLK